MKIDWRPYEPFEVASNPILLGSSLFSFDDYLSMTVNFLEIERRKYEQKVSKLETETALENERFDLQVAYFELQGFSVFENTIFSSFFIMLYSYLETELTQYYLDIEKNTPKEQLWSDISERKNTLDRVKEYLTKVQNFNFPSKSLEWEKIRNFTNLRNCIVHNQGRINSFREGQQKEKLLKFIQSKNSKIKLEADTCIIGQEFCLEALKTTKKFLSLVAEIERV